MANNNTIPLKLRILPNTNIIPLKLNIIPNIPTDHVCYVLKSSVSNNIYIGYTINFSHRLRQHNGEISGGAKKTSKHRPWYPICIIRGFYESSSALRFEARLQYATKKKRKVTIFDSIYHLVNSGDGSQSKDNIIAWPILNILWFHPSSSITHPRIINSYN